MRVNCHWPVSVITLFLFTCASAKDKDFDLAVGYSFGIDRPINQSMAVLYHSLSDEVNSQMAMGYRHLYGISVARSCDLALRYYGKAAEQLHNLQHQSLMPPVRLGAPRENDANILEFYHYNADFKGDTQAQLALGQLYRHGTRQTQRNPEKAGYYFNKVIAANDEHAANARNNLGEMYMKGEGFEKDISQAVKLFHSAAQDGNLHAYNNLGIVYRDGLEREVDKDKAAQFFKVASEGEDPDAMYNYGMSLLKKDASQAYKLLQAAAKSSHLKAIHQLAIMFQKGIAVSKSCSTGVTFMKHVSERWNHEIIETAYASYTLGDYNQALMQYLLASEQGYEVAQSNVAYLIKEEKSQLFNETHREHLLIVNRHRAANQGNVDARVWLGDYYFKQNNTQLATAFYHAAESEQSAVAMFNLGWMSDDLHIAKRYFDRALATDPSAALPVNLALFYIEVKHAWNSLFKGGSFFLDSAVVPETEVVAKTAEQMLLDDVLAPGEQQQQVVDEEAQEEAEWFSDESDIMFMLVLFAMAGVLFWARFNQQPNADVFNQQRQNMNIPAPEL